MRCKQIHQWILALGFCVMILAGFAQENIMAQPKNEFGGFVNNLESVGLTWNHYFQSKGRWQFHSQLGVNTPFITIFPTVGIPMRLAYGPARKNHVFFYISTSPWINFRSNISFEQFKKHVTREEILADDRIIFPYDQQVGFGVGGNWVIANHLYIKTTIGPVHSGLFWGRLWVLGELQIGWRA